MDVEIFSYETGWDFDLQEHQDHFIHRLPGARPAISGARCKNLAARTNVQQNKLYLKRKELHGCHLMFVAQVYKEQVDNARHARIEQPERALSWQETAFKDLPGKTIQWPVGPRWMVETCEEAHSHPFKKGLHAGCVVEAM